MCIRDSLSCLWIEYTWQLRVPRQAFWIPHLVFSGIQDPNLATLNQLSSISCLPVSKRCVPLLPVIGLFKYCVRCNGVRPFLADLGFAKTQPTYNKSIWKKKCLVQSLQHSLFCGIGSLVFLNDTKLGDQIKKNNLSMSSPNKLKKP